ncbi:hypothetical protein [Escherichia coli]|nr:hypothetical protein [Escherichia coli]
MVFLFLESGLQGRKQQVIPHFVVTLAAVIASQEPVLPAMA